ncbi:hypothetical protein LUZ63_002665 [Rhynchospora breviuscula]|uniref:3-hydroxyisobutyryl-CoA hydrolase n=1 Tax=Rhynchospora breviuscula TaxID=2022672 RepID=A0A9Q0CZ66_9POAL|nr:hypothetical protein LUZ63_002665 [Rhynchospora breviuscula]
MGYLMVTQLIEELSALEKRPNFKILVVKGNGRAFSAGGDNVGIWWCMTEGEYLGLTATRLDAPEMVACGLATHFVSSKNLKKLEESLNKIDTSDPSIIDMVINQHSENPPLREGCSLLNFYRSDIIDKCFSKGSVEEIIASLEQEFSFDPKEWIASAIKAMKTASPTNLKIFLKSWDPPTLAQVTDEMVNKCFRDIEDKDWPHLNLPSTKKSIPMTLLPARL